MKYLEFVGVMAILTSLVSDILRDTVGESLSKKNKLMEIGLTKGYDKARSYKWENNRYKDRIESIEKNGSYLEALAKLDKSGMTKMVTTVHKHMLMNVIGLQGYTEDSKEARMALRNAIRALEKNIKALDGQREQVQFYVDTGSGDAPQQMFTPRDSPQLSPGRLP
jgi:prefoldin subunit 5